MAELIRHPDAEPLKERWRGAPRVVGRKLELVTRKLGRTVIELFDERSGNKDIVGSVAFMEEDGWFKSYQLHAGLRSGDVFQMLRDQPYNPTGPLLLEEAMEVLDRLQDVIATEQQRGML